MATYFAASLSGAVIPSHKFQSYKKPYCSLPCSPFIAKSNRFPSSNFSTAIISSRRSSREIKTSTLQLAGSGLWGSKLVVKTSDQTALGSSTGRSCCRGGPAAAIAQVNEGIVSLAIAVGLPLVLGAANAVVSINPNASFYRDLKKPSLNPPNWLIWLAWGIFYPVMGVASWLVWSEGGFKKQAYPLAAYGVQLVLNLLWGAIFFKANKVRLALIDISALLVAAGVTAVLFKPVNPLAVYLLTPYLAWVAFAAFLNYNYLALNSSA